MELLFIALIGLALGLVKGTSGFGSSLVAIPLLRLFIPFNEVIYMMILLNVTLNFVLVNDNRQFFTWKNIKTILPIIISGIIFTYVGMYFLGELDEQIVRYIAAGLIFFAVVNKIFNLRLNMKDNFLTQTITGMFSGLGNGIASIDGPPVVVFLQSTDTPKDIFKSKLATHFLILGLFSVAGHLVVGNYTLDILKNTGYLFIFAIIGILTGIFVGRKLDEKIFQIVVYIVLVGLGISMFI